VFAIAVLANRSMSVREAWMLFGLFIAQFVLGGVLPEGLRELERIGVGVVYLVLAAVFLIQQRSSLKPLVRDGLVVPVDQLFHEDAPGEARS
jgi:cation:H+ antiporter